MNEITYLSEFEEVSMADKWFDINDKNHFWMSWRFKYFMLYRELIEHESLNILEVGCGNGIFMEQLYLSMNKEIDGCDLNEYALKSVSHNHGRLFVYNIYDLHPEMVGKYDALILFDVLEHIDDDKDFLLTATKHLKKGSLIFINVPALNQLYSRYDKLVGHVRRYNRTDMKELLDGLDLEIVDIKYWGILLLPIAVLRKIYMLFIPDEKVAEKGFKPPSKFVNKIFITLMKLELKLFNSKHFGTSVMAVARKK